MTTNIYILIDPTTEEVRYVGKANNLKERYVDHVNKIEKANTHKNNWIKSLKNKGFKPTMELIDVVPIKEWIYWESYWISQMRAWGFRLTNSTNGGDGSTFGNKGSFKFGHTPWNEGNSNMNECVICGDEFKTCISEDTKTCSRACLKIYSPTIKNSGRYKKGQSPHNTKIIYQYTKDKEFIKEWSQAKCASKELSLNAEAIRQCANGRIKSSGGYFWTYIKLK